MVEKRAVLALLLATTLTGSVSAASATRQTVSPAAAKSARVADHIARFDGRLPTLLLMRDRLIRLFQASHGIGMVIFPTVGMGNQVFGIQDGPDGVDPLGAKGTGIRGEGSLPATSSTRTP